MRSQLLLQILRHLNILFIHGKNVLMPHLLLLFNKIFDKGYFPESWSDGFIIPLTLFVHKLELFDKLVLPILTYGCEVWGFHTAISIERVHLQFCKRLLGVKMYSCIFLSSKGSG